MTTFLILATFAALGAAIEFCARDA